MNTRELALLAAFAALAGALEASLGAVLHALGVPLTGAFMACTLVLVLLTGRAFVPRRGAVITMGAAVAVIKLLSIGGTTLTPALAILIETGLAELALLAPGRRGPVRHALAGAAALLWPPLQPVTRHLATAGADLGAIYLGLARRVAELTGTEPRHLAWLVGLFLALHAAAGALAGYGGYRAGRRARSRMGLEEAA